MPTEFEKQILAQADEIRRREVEGTVDAVDPGFLAGWYEMYGTAEQAEQARARAEGREPEWHEPNPMGAGGAPVPPDQIRDAATHQPMVPQPTADEVPDGDEDDPTAPVRETDPEVESYDEWGKPDLVEEAKVRGLPHSGNKEDLVARLRDDDAQHVAVNSGPPADNDE